MTIYYNPAYSSSPYRNKVNKVEFGNVYCGDIQLLQRLLFYAGVAYKPVSNEERFTYYHNEIKGKIEGDSLFYKSFETDSSGMSLAVLSWRDALVEVGFDVESYDGDSKKLVLLKQVEPEMLPLGNADYWNMLIKLSEKKRILPEGFCIEVTCKKAEIKPSIAYILDCQQSKGVQVEYVPTTKSVAEGNLGKIQNTIHSGVSEKIKLDSEDNTFSYIKFTTEDDILRYVATEPIQENTLYFSTKAKRFDNTLKLLGKPTIGSSIKSKSPQVAQLFSIGNGLFEYPLNVNRIVEWLNMSISPLDNKLRRILSDALINSGGINNIQWNKDKDAYINSIEDEKEREVVKNEYLKFMPIAQSEKVSVKNVISFNKDLCKWAVKLLNMDRFPYSEEVKAQLISVKSYCTSLLKMLESAPKEIRFIDLQLWCKNIIQESTFEQYFAEVNSHNILNAMGDIHDDAEHIIWFAAEDSGVPSYPFEMLNDDEYNEIEKCGAKLYKREKHSQIIQASLLRILLNTKKLTIMESEKSAGKNVVRHPLILQLNERIEGGLKNISTTKTISEECIKKDSQVVVEKSILLKLEEGISIKERHERVSDENKQAESYSSLNQLIQHPFEYVCEKCAKLKDYSMPSAQDLSRTLGNVAHLIVETVFNGRDLSEAREYFTNNYEEIFEQAVTETGLLLRLPECAVELRRLKQSMKQGLTKLADFIQENGLTVEACEYDFQTANWSDAGKYVKLSSRADMLLTDNEKGKVILDFKHSVSNKRKEEIEENRALQLELYKFLCKKEFGEDIRVRVAYVLLPEIDIYTADYFKGVDSLNVQEFRNGINIMDEAAKSYKFRWEQLKENKIERVEGEVVGTGEYANQTGLFPLSVYNGNYSVNGFDKGYKNLK